MSTQNDTGRSPVLYQHEYLKKQHTYLYDMLSDEYRHPGHFQREQDRLDAISWEFEDDRKGGRGANYNRAQTDLKNRKIGMETLLSMFGNITASAHHQAVILDVLSGDGTLRRFAEHYLENPPDIISADISALMIESCIKQGFPCIRQSATKSLLADNVLDGVLIAYGTHHIPPYERAKAVSEAWRTLKPGGRLVIHDFELGGAVDQWFRNVVHPYSETGHPHLHFTADEMLSLLSSDRFEHTEVRWIDDPFTIQRPSSQECRDAMLRHLHEMYGLVKLPLETPAEFGRFQGIVTMTLGPVQTSQAESGFQATLHRKALVGIGTKKAKSRDLKAGDALESWLYT